MRMLPILVVFMFLAPLCYAADKAPPVPEDHCRDKPPEAEDLITTPQAAIGIAFAEWRAITPDLQVDESVWQSGFTATLHNCVWDVAEPPENYSTFVVRVGAQDGRYLGALIRD